MKRDLSETRAIASQTLSRLSAATSIIALVVSVAGCSTSRGSPEDTWTATFFNNSDRVWNAIELTLLELDYEVTTENRADGVIRAESAPAEDGTVIVLAIDQVVRTEDQVNVYVKPSVGGSGVSTNQDLLKAAADAFVKTLEDQLRG